MKDALYMHTDDKGREFTISGDLQALESSLSYLVNVDPDDEDYGINHINKSYEGNDRWTAEERAKDEAGLTAVLEYRFLEWTEVFNKIAKKKNGTFAKNRVHVIHRGHTYAHYWEDSYGWNAPEIRLKSINDFTAVLELVDTIEKY